MAIDQVVNQAWTRKHDDSAQAVVPKAALTLYPKSLIELIALCQKRNPLAHMHAAGSHWALSDAAVSDDVFIETHDPGNQHQALGRTLYEVVPSCLSQDFTSALAAVTVPPYDTDPRNVAENGALYPVHIETGKRVYQLYAELDFGDEGKQSLATLLNNMGNPSYLGPWAFRTLGGAGGQTVFGALTTGTHGGDFRTPPIADSVLAIHLVADGGKHYWIEPESGQPLGALLTDAASLNALYGQEQFGGATNFQVLRDDALFNAVLISAGRFGIVYSIVIAAVRQYSLHCERRLTTWQAIKSQIMDPTSSLYTQIGDVKTMPPLLPSASNRFLQIAVSLTSHSNFTLNLAGVTKKCNVPLAVSAADPSKPAGRAERVGDAQMFDPTIGAQRFGRAGNSFPYSPDPTMPGAALPPDFLSRACSDGQFLEGALKIVLAEIEEFVRTNGANVGTTVALVAGFGGGTLLPTLIAALATLIPVLAALLAIIAATGPRLGQALNEIRAALLSSPDPATRLAGLFVWQMISFKAFEAQQGDLDFEAISYAAMDGHNYLDRSCNLNVDSIEAFFDATDPMLIAFVDALIAYDAKQSAIYGRAFVGYASLRFMGPSRALIGQHRFPLTCSVEVAGLRDTSGVTELINFALGLAMNNNVRAILHWGQRNPSTQAHVERRFGDRPESPGGRLGSWRAALSRITDNGRLDGFSNPFSRQTGLEIVRPVITSLTAAATSANTIEIGWDCDHNPPATAVRLEIGTPGGSQIITTALARTGLTRFEARDSGVYTIVLFASIGLGSQQRQTSQKVLTVVP
jgi:hypothetical protein